MYSTVMSLTCFKNEQRDVMFSLYCLLNNDKNMNSDGELTTCLTLSLKLQYSTKCHRMLIFLCLYSSLCLTVPYSWYNNLSNNRLTVPCCFLQYVLSLVIADAFIVHLNIGSLAHDDPFLVFTVHHRFCRVRIRSLFSA